MLSNHESRHDTRKGAGGFGIIMPCDAQAEAARREFQLLREAAKPSIDAAAIHWSEARVEHCRTEEVVTAAEAVKQEATAGTVPRTERKSHRKNGRTRHRTVA